MSKSVNASCLGGQVARRARLHLVYVPRHARRAGRPGPQRVPRVTPAGGSPLPPPAGGGPALGRHRGRVATRCGDLPAGGLPLPGAAGNSGREIRPGAASALAARPASLPLGESVLVLPFFILISYAYILKYSFALILYTSY